jgi:hypothetical protein
VQLEKRYLYVSSVRNTEKNVSRLGWNSGLILLGGRGVTSRVIRLLMNERNLMNYLINYVLVRPFEQSTSYKSSYKPFVTYGTEK